MPILSLRFKLPEEESEAQIAQKACEYHSMLCDLRELMRKLYKYDEREMIPKEEIINSLKDIIYNFE